MNTLAERLAAKIDVRGPDDCWEWTACTDENGYGRISANISGERRQTFGAHRLSYEFTNGPIADGLSVLHRCDNPPCCNPAHLFLGTQADNNIDMARKGRNAWSQKTHCPAGHEYSPENTCYDAKGRRCRECIRRRDRMRWLRKRAARVAVIPATLVLTLAGAGIADAHTPSFEVSCQGGLTVSGADYQGGSVDIVYGSKHEHHTIGSTFTFHVPTPDKTAVEHYVVTIDATDGTTFDHTYQGSVQPCQSVTGSSAATTTTSRPPSPPTSPSTSNPTPSTTTPPSTTSAPGSTAGPSVSSAPTVATPSTPASSSPPAGSSSTTATTPAALSNTPSTPTTSATRSSAASTELPATGLDWWTFTMAAALVLAAGCAAIRAVRRSS